MDRRKDMLKTKSGTEFQIVQIKLSTHSKKAFKFICSDPSPWRGFSLTENHDNFRLGKV